MSSGSSPPVLGSVTAPSTRCSPIISGLTVARASPIQLYTFPVTGLRQARHRRRAVSAVGALSGDRTV